MARQRAKQKCGLEEEGTVGHGVGKGCEIGVAERWAIILFLRSLDLIILYQIRLMNSAAASAVKPDRADSLVIVEVELVVVEIVALQRLEVDLIPAN